MGSKVHSKWMVRHRAFHFRCVFAHPRSTPHRRRTRCTRCPPAASTGRWSSSPPGPQPPFSWPRRGRRREERGAMGDPPGYTPRFGIRPSTSMGGGRFLGMPLVDRSLGWTEHFMQTQTVVQRGGTFYAFRTFGFAFWVFPPKKNAPNG